MKFKRKEVTQYVEAWFWDQQKLGDDAPAWVKKYTDTQYDPYHKIYSLKILTEFSETCVNQPMWLIQEPRGIGCYPVSREYMKEHFTKVDAP